MKTMAKKVMIVEDNDLNMKLFRDLVQIGNYQAIEIRKGNEAIAAALDCAPDLIIMDIQLPEISGIDLIKEIKANEKLQTIPVLAVTAFAMPGDEERIRASGCEDYIAKPICISSFQAILKKYLA